MAELEEMLMRRGQIRYKEARSIVLDSRTTLGLSKYGPWTPELKATAEKVFVSRHGPFKTDNTIGTSQSFDTSDFEGTDHPKSVQIDMTEATETEGGLEESTIATEELHSPKKKRRSFFGRFRLSRNKDKQKQ